LFFVSLCVNLQICKKKKRKERKLQENRRKKNETNKRTKKRHRIEQYPQESWRKQHQ